ncbi:MAG: DUF5683 domain-containing protein [Marinifilaceae bacterium]|nr:DUF5683 domain-containing protein [Marinifilaceae bacterium]
MKAGFSEFLRKGILGIAIFLMVTGAGKAAEREERMVFLVRDTLPDMGLPHLEGKVDTDSLLMGTDLALDTLTRAQKRLMKRRMETKPHSPHKATILAIVLPGAGQVYNRQWWKLPILYGGVGAAIYGLSWNTKYYNKYRDAFVDYTAYLNQIAEDKENDRETPYPTDNKWDQLMAPGKTAEGYSESMQKRFQEVLKTKKENYKRNRDLMYIVCAGIYAVQIIDAVVFAHFYDFEINEDLSMKIAPSTGFSPACGGTVGLTLSLRF